MRGCFKYNQKKGIRQDVASLFFLKKNTTRAFWFAIAMMTLWLFFERFSLLFQSIVSSKGDKNEQRKYIHKIQKSSLRESLGQFQQNLAQSILML